MTIKRPEWLLIAFILLLALAFSKDLEARESWQVHAPSGIGSWTESSWINWWSNIEDLYLSGLEDEGMYWLLRHDLELLGQYEEILGDIEIPPPYPGWSDGGPGDPSPPVNPYSSSSSTSERSRDYMPMYGQMPEEWGPLIEQHGLDPALFSSGMHIAPPPMWVAASISLIGTNLLQMPHPGTKVVGYVLVNAGGIMIIWIELEDDDDTDEE